MQKLRVGLLGATGRVGHLIMEALKIDDYAQISAVFVRKSSDFSDGSLITVTNDMRLFLKSCDVVIDFSLPNATEKLLEASLDILKPLVIGTTGLSNHQLNLMQQACEKMPILYATNMSLGVALLNKLTTLASKTLIDFDIEIVEMHHKHKKDAPSGTALTLARHAANARSLDIDKVRISGRDGNIGKRSKDEISVMALRGGDVVGKHSVGFYGDSEFIELNHTATNKTAFVHGAIKAAKWIVNQSQGLHTITQCLGLEDA